MDFAKNFLSKYGWTEGKITIIIVVITVSLYSINNNAVRLTFGANNVVYSENCH